MNTFCRIIRIRSEASSPITPTQVVTFVNFIVRKDVYKAQPMLWGGVQTSSAAHL